MNPKDKHIKLRTVFMGTSDLAQDILKVLVEAKYNIVGVYTKPDKKVGRKQELQPSPVKIFAQENKIAVLQPVKFDTQAVDELKRLKPDLIIVAAYGRILPKAVLNTPGFGCINVHPSLLPKFRGPSPVQNALLSGETETGITIMLMDEGMDTGDILFQKSIAIDPHETASQLLKKLAPLGAQALLETVPLWVNRKIEPQPQNKTHASLCQLIEREDGRIYWNDEAQDIYNRYRALHSWPGIFTFWVNDGILVRIKLLSITLQKNDPQLKQEIGKVFEIGDNIGVQTLSGVIILDKVQLEGKTPVSIKEFVNGYPNFVGNILS